MGWKIVAAILPLMASAATDAATVSDQDVTTAIQRNAWYLPTEDKSARLFVTEIGQGDPAVFLHGGPGNDFQYVIDALIPHVKRHRFILFDDRGSLLSPVAPDKVSTVTLTALVEDLDLLRRSTGQEKLTLFGHSFGSLLALAYYQAHPEHVRRIVLAAAFAPNKTLAATIADMRPLQQELRSRPLIDRVLAAEGLTGTSLTARQESDRWRIRNLAALNVIHLERWRQVTGGKVFYSEAMDNRIGDSLPPMLDVTETILTHPVPITIIQGDSDYLDRGAVDWKAFAAAHPEAPITIEVMPQASHYAWIDAPRPFAAALARGLLR